MIDDLRCRAGRDDREDTHDRTNNQNRIIHNDHLAQFRRGGGAAQATPMGCLS